MSDTYWRKLDSALNDSMIIQAFGKKVIDKADETALEALGILQLWVFQFGETELNTKWSPILERVSQCKAATKAVV